jgi:DNA-nicking Smr family endonuclease
MDSPPEDPDFKRAVADAKPLKHKKRVVPPRGAAPVPKQRLLDERAALAESLGPVSLDDALDSGTELSYLKEGYPRDTLRKLRRGHWIVQAELDLHGLNRYDAREAVAQFLGENLTHRRRCVRIIHGKGASASRY